MIRAGVGQSSVHSTEEAVAQAAAMAMAQAGIDRADEAVIFFTAEHAASKKQLLDTVRRATGTEKIVGSSGAGVLTHEGEVEGRRGIAILVFASDQLKSRSFIFAPLRDRDNEIGVEIGQTCPPTTQQNPLMVLFPDTYNGQPRRLLDSIQRQIGFVPLVGAGSSENGTAQATYQICGDSLMTNSVVGALISGSFQASIDITQGCQPITKPMVITRAEKNLIFEIDHRPAVEVFAELLKGPLAEDLRRALMFVFAALPASRDRNSVAPGQYVVRNIIGVDPDKGILGVAEEVHEGQAILFTLRDGNRAREDLSQMLQRQAQKLDGKRPAFGFYFNCCARGRSLYGVPGIDSAYIRQALGDFPLIGMFGGYELAPLGNANHLFAYTGVLALITE
ncbi:MAG TPA: FIST N-terminal domain-containing protein [Candidatus Binatia bacterium]|nr:FIST N-terminal domain-containing protein [Candidatus Binatia bacterium]